MGLSLRKPIVFFAVVALLGSARADEAGGERRDGARVWHLASYLNGTPEEIRRILSRDMEVLLAQRNTLLVEMSRRQEAIDAAQAYALDKLRRNPDLIRLQEMLKQAEAAWDDARTSGSPEERLDASLAYLQTEQKLDKMRHDAIAGDQATRKLQSYQAQDRERLRACNDAVGRTAMWRRNALEGIAEYKAFSWPLLEGVEGIVRTITPERIIGKDDFECTLQVPETLHLGLVRDDLAVGEVQMHPVRVLISGMDTSALRVGKPVKLDTTVFHIVRTSILPIGGICVMRPVPGDLENLLKTINTLGVSITTAELDELVRSADRNKPEARHWGTIGQLLAAVPQDFVPKLSTTWSDSELEKVNDWLHHEVSLDTIVDMPVVIRSSIDRGGDTFQIGCDSEDRPGHSNQILLRCDAWLRTKATQRRSGAHIKIKGTIQAVIMRKDGTLFVNVEDASF